MATSEQEQVGYPNIEKAHLEIAYDNGGINRYRSEDKAQRELRCFLPQLPYTQDVMLTIDAWLGSLSADDLQAVCIGEDCAADALLMSAPPHTQAVLTAIFEYTEGVLTTIFDNMC